MMTYSMILQGSDSIEEIAIDYAIGYDFSDDEIECYNFNIHDNTFIKDVNGIGVWYNKVADYYFFEPIAVNQGLQAIDVDIESGNVTTSFKDAWDNDKTLLI